MKPVPEFPARSAAEVLARRQVQHSAAINAALSVAFFLGVFGLPDGPLAFGSPDQLAFDFLPQAGMIGLMSALVPPFAVRKKLAEVTGAAPCPASRIVLGALALALGALAIGGGAALLAVTLPIAALAPWQAFALKAGFGAALGAGITALALRRLVMPAQRP